jgi:hypothetical protein
VRKMQTTSPMLEEIRYLGHEVGGSRRCTVRTYPSHSYVCNLFSHGLCKHSQDSYKLHVFRSDTHRQNCPQTALYCEKTVDIENGYYNIGADSCHWIFIHIYLFTDRYHIHLKWMYHIN